MNITSEDVYKLTFEGKMANFLLLNGKKVKSYSSDNHIKTYYIRYENNIGYAGLIRNKEDFNVIKNIPLPLYSISIKT